MIKRIVTLVIESLIVIQLGGRTDAAVALLSPLTWGIVSSLMRRNKREPMKGEGSLRNTWMRVTAITTLTLVVGCVTRLKPMSAERLVATPIPGLERSLIEHVAALVGQRSYLDKNTYDRLEQAALYIEGKLREVRDRVPNAVLRSQSYSARGRCYRNIELELPGSDRAFENVVIGAHYDSDGYESRGVNPGADDNASGVAALIELAKLLGETERRRTVRFVAFSTEEEPFFHTRDMGSSVYARSAAERGLAILAMLSLETVGYYDDTPGSQNYPLCLRRLLTNHFGYPDKGNFIAFVGNSSSRAIVQCTLDTYNGAVPAEGIVASSLMPGVSWSDQWSFWKVGYPALMVTDTALQRNRCYHKGCDQPGLLDYDRIARVVVGLSAAVEALADPDQDLGCASATPSDRPTH